MCSKPSVGRLNRAGGLDVRLPRTRVLLLGLVLVAAGWPAPGARAQGDVDMLGGMELMEAGEEGEGLGPDRSELEASMHSSLLQDFQEATEGLQLVDDGETTRSRHDSAPPAVFPDSLALVGRVFHIKVPNKTEDVSMGEIVKVSYLNCLNTECMAEFL